MFYNIFYCLPSFCFLPLRLLYGFAYIVCDLLIVLVVEMDDSCLICFFLCRRFYKYVEDGKGITESSDAGWA